MNIETLLKISVRKKRNQNLTRTVQTKRLIYDLITLSDEELNNISNITFKIPKNSKHKENDNSVEEENNQLLGKHIHMNPFPKNKLSYSALLQISRKLRRLKRGLH